jgi:hypothetical protein
MGFLIAKSLNRLPDIIMRFDVKIVKGGRFGPIVLIEDAIARYGRSRGVTLVVQTQRALQRRTLNRVHLDKRGLVARIRTDSATSRAQDILKDCRLLRVHVLRVVLLIDYH